MDPSSQFALVTGSASGLGRAIAQRLARDGWHVALADVNLEANRATAELVLQAGGTPRLETLDVRSTEQWVALIGRLKGEWPRLDLLVNNAGVLAAGEAHQFSPADWDWVIDINLRGVAYGCHACLDWMLANPRGAHLVNIASIAGFLPMPSLAAYNASKAAVLALSETLYAELLETPVGVTVVCPGFFQTGLLDHGRVEHDYSRRLARQMMDRAVFDATDVAEQIMRAMRQKRLYVVLPARARRYWWLKRWVPVWVARRLGWLYRNRDPEAL